jgi:ankyrin repeat/BTB/POZ domain-containing protein 2
LAANAQGCPTVQAETQHWTALTYAALVGNVTIAKLLLDRGAHVEGGARLSEDRCTITPLQVASSHDNLEMVSLLLSHGAHPFLSTLLKDSLCYSGSAQRGCYRYVPSVQHFKGFYPFSGICARHVVYKI